MKSIKFIECREIIHIRNCSMDDVDFFGWEKTLIWNWRFMQVKKEKNVITSK